jgi:hypothetical protein
MAKCQQHATSPETLFRELTDQAPGGWSANLTLGLLPTCPSSNRNPSPVISVDDRSRLIASVAYCSFANSVLACFKMGRSGSAFFQFANRVS